MIIELRLLFPVVAEIEPPWIRPLDKRNLPSATPALQLLLTRDCIVHIAKVFDPDESIQPITFREALYFGIPMMVQSADNVVGDPDIQCCAMFVRENVNPIVVVAHARIKIRDVSLRST